MTSGGNEFKRKFRRWLESWQTAGMGIVLATKNYKFVMVAGVTFVVFGTLMNLLSGSSAALDLFWMADASGKVKIIWDGFLGIFGVGRNFWDFLLTFMVTLLQSVLIGLIALVWRKRRRSRKAQVVATATNADNIQNAGLAAGLAVLGSGCPTCGTTLLAPVIGTFFSTSSYALASALSGILTTASILIALFSLRRIGGDAYAMIVSERFQNKRSAKAQSNSLETQDIKKLTTSKEAHS